VGDPCTRLLTYYLSNFITDVLKTNNGQSAMSFLLANRCVDLLSIYYEEHLEEDLEELRVRWRIDPAPERPPRAAAPKVSPEGYIAA
jgi:ubiquinone biosynthesis protein Coq4